jgi:rare lipoprotein A
VRVPITLIALWAALFLVTGCASAPRGDGGGGGGAARETGVASYYAHKYHGRTTASGERFDMNDLTAAHKTLPFGTRVRVTNLDNGKSVTVRVNDRGPFVKGRVIDLSLAAAKKVDMVKAGLANVEVRRVGTHASIVTMAE